MFMHLFGKYAKRHKINIHSFCLMDNHYHAACTPFEEDALSLMFGQTNWAYATYYNGRYEKSGHVWQERFGSCFLHGIHLPRAMRYIERNPVKANIVETPTEWPWSSARASCGLDSMPPWLVMPDWWHKSFSAKGWNTFICKAGTEQSDKCLTPTPREYTRKRQ